MLCVVGRVLLRKVLTSYQSTLEEEQNQQLLVRLVLSQFQAQARERQALSNMASLLDEETGAVPKPGSASKRKLKKERKALRQAEEGAVNGASSHGSESAVNGDADGGGCETCEPLASWDEDQERRLLAQMGWGECMGSTCANPSCGVADDDDDSERVPPLLEDGVPVGLPRPGGEGGASAHEGEVPTPVQGADPISTLELTTAEWREWEEMKAREQIEPPPPQGHYVEFS